MINVIIPHFVKYPLLTQKRADFELFKSIVEMLHRKEHLSPNGLQQIVNIRALINNGLSDTLKAAFPHVTPVPRPVVEPSEIPDPNWLAFVASPTSRPPFSLTLMEGQSPPPPQIPYSVERWIACLGGRLEGGEESW